MPPLSSLNVGETAKITDLPSSGEESLALWDMGLRVNETITLLSRLPFGGNLVFMSRNGKYSIRKKQASLIKTKVH